MPTYEYKCKACDHRFEQFQSMTAAPIKVCPECKKRKVERLIGTGAALLFKGSGFYTTDYRSDGYKKKAEADKPASDAKPSTDSKPAAPEAKPAAPVETKPAPKPETTDRSKSDKSPKKR